MTSRHAVKSTVGNALLAGLVYALAWPLSSCAEQKPQKPLVNSVEAQAAHGDNGHCTAPLFGKLFARTELFFGLSKPDGSRVSDWELREFVDRQVTPRFPDGLTVLAGLGRFKDASGTTRREPSRILVLLYPFGETGASQKVEAIREAYKESFKQESVLRADAESCVSF